LLGLTRVWGKQWRTHVWITGVSLMICSIWIIRNAIVFREFIPVAASGYGTNLLLGSMGYDEAADLPRRRALLDAVDASGGVPSTDESRFDRVRLNAALTRIKANPSHWLKARAEQYPHLFFDSGSYLFGDDVRPFGTAVSEHRWFEVLVRITFVVGNILVFLLAAYALVLHRARLNVLGPVILFPVYMALVALPVRIEPRYG